MGRVRQRAPSSKQTKQPLTVEEVIKQKRDKLATRSSFWGLIGKILFVGIAVFAVFNYVFGIGVVNGESMYPRMRDGDLVVYFRMEPEQNIGDIITFMVNGERQFARVVARGGDVVDMTEDGLLKINGNIQAEEVFFSTSKEERATTFPCRVETDSVFVLCDNRTAALDSRDYGTIPVSSIDGKVITLLRRRGL